MCAMGWGWRLCWLLFIKALLVPLPGERRSCGNEVTCLFVLRKGKASLISRKPDYVFHESGNKARHKAPSHDYLRAHSN